MITVPKFGDTQALGFIEDAREMDAPIDDADVLSDDQLQRGGLVKVEAFVRTKTGADAARKAKHREKQEAAGLKQANIVTTADTVEEIKAIAKACAAGKTLADAIIAVVPAIVPTAAPVAPSESVTSHVLVTEEEKELKRLADVGKKIERLTGWRKLLFRFLGLISE